jgi:transposase InsO family protein
VANGQICNRKTVAKCMKQAGIYSNSHRLLWGTTTNPNHPHAVAKNLVSRNFQPSQKNETWTGDIMDVATDKEWLFMAAVDDLLTPEIVGWSISDRIDCRLEVDASQMAISRLGHGGDLMAYSDRGVQ